jgi:hypothetical protein
VVKGDWKYTHRSLDIPSEGCNPGMMPMGGSGSLSANHESANVEVAGHSHQISLLLKAGVAKLSCSDRQSWAAFGAPTPRTSGPSQISF